MPRRSGPVSALETISREERLRIDNGRNQENWYNLITTRWAAHHTVLDVGAGLGLGMDILSTAPGARVEGIDPAPMRADITARALAAIPATSYDLVVACDVIEHVEDDRAFLIDLMRVARQRVFFSTPNWNTSHAVNPFHVREYTPEELLALLATVPPWHRHFFTATRQRVITPIVTPRAADSAFGILLECRR